MLPVGCQGLSESRLCVLMTAGYVTRLWAHFTEWTHNRGTRSHSTHSACTRTRGCYYHPFRLPADAPLCGYK